MSYTAVHYIHPQGKSLALNAKHSHQLPVDSVSREDIPAKVALSFLIVGFIHERSLSA